MDTGIFIIAVKRDHRGAEPVDWQERIGRVNGIDVISSTSSRLQVRASRTVIDNVRSQWGDLFHIEEEVKHTFRV